jgi:hypothetical protein
MSFELLEFQLENLFQIDFSSDHPEKTPFQCHSPKKFFPDNASTMSRRKTTRVGGWEFR